MISSRSGVGLFVIVILSVQLQQLLEARVDAHQELDHVVHSLAIESGLVHCAIVCRF